MGEVTGRSGRVSDRVAIFSKPMGIWPMGFKAVGLRNKPKESNSTGPIPIVADAISAIDTESVTAVLDGGILDGGIPDDAVAQSGHAKHLRPGELEMPHLSRLASGPIRGFDALRAFAILGVLAYHLMPKAVPGGFLGVDIFFVLSGFLITRGLCATWAKRGNLKLGAFYQRRFNRIVPSLVVVLLTCTTIALAVGGDVLVGVDKQIYGAVSFASNWFTIAAGGDYFAATTPALFANLWFLALDVQFYLLWPPLLLLLFRRVRPNRLWLWAAGLGLVSAGLMLGLSLTGAGQTRLYEGTDTHFFSLMFGSALALGFAYNSERLVRVSQRVSAWRAGQFGWLAACALGVMFLTLPWVSQASFRGLMVLASLLSVVLLYLLVSYPALGSVLERQPWQWIGKHSYGIFLWHWPLLIILSGAFGQRYTEAPWWLIVGVLALSVVFTLGTERLVNSPVHALGLRGYFHRVWRLPRPARVGIAAVVATGLVGTGAAAATAPTESLITRQILAGAQQAALTRPVATAGKVLLSDGTWVLPSEIQHDANYLLDVAVASGADTVPISEEVLVPELPPVISPTGNNVTAIGDSVLLAATPQIVERLPGIWIDGAVSRQFFAATPIVAELKEAGELRHYVIVALATNGTVTAEWVDQLIDAIGPDHEVLFINGYGDRAWIPDANAQLVAATERFGGQVHLIDWNTAAAADPSLLGGDGIHPKEPGMERYAELIVAALDSFVNGGDSSARSLMESSPSGVQPGFADIAQDVAQ